MQDISRLARQQSAEAESLRTTVEHLRKDSEKLSLLIQAIQSRATDDLATTSGTWGIGTRSRATGDRASRSAAAITPAPVNRSAAAVSSPSIRPLSGGAMPSPRFRARRPRPAVRDESRLPQTPAVRPLWSLAPHRASSRWAVAPGQQQARAQLAVAASDSRSRCREATIGARLRPSRSASRPDQLRKQRHPRVGRLPVPLE